MKKILILMLGAFLVISANAQIKKGEWTVGPVITTTNPIYSGVATLLLQGIEAVACGENGFPPSAQLIYPDFSYNWHAIKKLEINDNKAKFQHKMDWELKNYSVGYRFGYMSRTIPLGFELQANYEQESMSYKFPNDENYRDITKTMLVPVALLKIRFGSYATESINPVLEVGGSYDYALSFKEKHGDTTIKGKEYVNNGFSGIVGLGITIPLTHVSFSIRYSHKFYKYYNSEAEYNGKMLDFNEKSTFGTFTVASSYAF